MIRSKLLVLAAFSIAACGNQASSSFLGETIDCQRSALELDNLSGTSLSSKELSLTFDDGPGSRTLELSSYLKGQGIKATFFSNGHCFDDSNPCGNRLSPQEIYSQLHNDGHLVANHTQDHYDLTDISKFPLNVSGDIAIVNEVKQTDLLLAAFVDQNHFLFRAPYGAWDERSFQVLSNSEMNKYLGPVRWDIGGMMTDTFAADWDCWQDKDGYGVQTTVQCGNRYLNEIHSVGRGIVLMHDSDQVNSQIGNTVDMVKYLVPILKAEGYHFARADEVPSIRDLLGVPPPPPPPVEKDADIDISDADADISDASDASSKLEPNNNNHQRFVPDPVSVNKLQPAPVFSICH